MMNRLGIILNTEEFRFTVEDPSRPNFSEESLKAKRAEIIQKHLDIFSKNFLESDSQKKKAISAAKNKKKMAESSTEKINDKLKYRQ
jgi:hypothetical protein